MKNNKRANIINEYVNFPKKEQRDKRVDQLLEFLKKNKGVSYKKISKVLNIPSSTLTRYLRILKERGDIEIYEYGSYGNIYRALKS